jgi:hypothetical protein
MVGGKHIPTASLQQNSGGVSSVHHPPYNPDLAPSDFHVLGKLKKISKAGNFHLPTPSKMRSRNGFGSRMSPAAARA